MPDDIFDRMKDQMANSPKGVPVDAEALEKLMRILNDDVAQGGWDQQAALYVVLGSVDDPYFAKAMPLDGHPAAAMQEAWDSGHHEFNDRVIGVAIASEGWRHLYLDEADAVTPGLKDSLYTMARSVYPEKTEDEIRIEANNTYTKVLTNHAPPPSQMPDDRHVETRQIVVIFKDGSSAGIIQDRDAEPTLLGLDGKSSTSGGRIYDFALNWLNGRSPNTDEPNYGKDI